MEEEKTQTQTQTQNPTQTLVADSSARASSSFVALGDRQRFTVDLRPGETTIVSWRKLIKDSNRLNGSTSVPQLLADSPPSIAHPALETRIAPGQPSEKELKEEPASNRFSAVIEKIERLYMGNQSSDEEDLNDFPDDNQYDTEDSFIDDAELDEYFEVDNSATKHKGFFVNRGRLERVNESTLLPNQQLKKRRRKDVMKSHVNDAIHVTNKQGKFAKKPAGRLGNSAASIGKNSSIPSPSVEMSEHFVDANLPNKLSDSVQCSKKKAADTRNVLDPCPSSKVSNGDAPASFPEAKDTEKQKAGVLQSKNLGNKSKDATGVSNDSYKKIHDRSSHAPVKPQSARHSIMASEQEHTVRVKEKIGNRELPDLNIPEVKDAIQTTKTPHVHRKESSSTRPRSTMLEKAIRELEKMVAESRPPGMEVQDADNSSQAVKRRLPREIKQKLAKVARLASTQGKVTKELLNRLMSILGHMIQLRTLKRHLKIMINMGLSAKKEKDDLFQQIKKEVVGMIKMQFPSLKSRASEQLVGASDDFQDGGSDEKAVLKRKFSMDSATEEKICDLYDLYVDGLDEEVGPQIRQLYAELAGLWPNGFMDNRGIKRAICRAKDRRKALYYRQTDLEKSERKKLISKMEETVSLTHNVRERLAADSGSHGLPPSNRPISNTSAPGTRMLSPSINSSSLEKPKLEKIKGSLAISSIDGRTVDGALIKKKAKRKPEADLNEGHYSRAEKLAQASSQQGDDRQQFQKQVAIPPKPNLHLGFPSCSEPLK